MAPTITTVISDCQQAVPDFMRMLAVDVRVETTSDQLVHAGRTGCDLQGRGSVVLKYLVDLRWVCRTCMRPSVLPEIAARPGAFLLALYNLRKTVKSRETTRRDAAATMHRRRTRLAGEVAKLVDARQAVTLNPTESTLVDDLLARAAGARATLDELLGAGNDRLLADIRARVFGVHHADAVIDETPTLVGIHPYDARHWKTDTAAAVEQFRVKGDKVVLLVPRYVAFWLAGKAAGGHGLHMPADADGLTGRDQDTVVRLWEPDGTGPLSTLAGAIAAARLL